MSTDDSHEDVPCVDPCDDWKAVRILLGTALTYIRDSTNKKLLNPFALFYSDPDVIPTDVLYEKIVVMLKVFGVEDISVYNGLEKEWFFRYIISGHFVQDYDPATLMMPGMVSDIPFTDEQYNKLAKHPDYDKTYKLVHGCTSEGAQKTTTPVLFNAETMKSLREDLRRMEEVQDRFEMVKHDKLRRAQLLTDQFWEFAQATAEQYDTTMVNIFSDERGRHLKKWQRHAVSPKVGQHLIKEFFEKKLGERWGAQGSFS